MRSLRDSLQQLRDDTSIDTQIKVIDILASALDSLTENNKDALEIETATAIRKLDPKLEQYEDADALQDDVWTTMVDVAARVPCKHHGQSFLVDVVANLDTHPGVVGDVRTSVGNEQADFRRTY